VDLGEELAVVFLWMGQRDDDQVGDDLVGVVQEQGPYSVRGDKYLCVRAVER
jgi:hypothetical protein